MKMNLLIRTKGQAYGNKTLVRGPAFYRFTATQLNRRNKNLSSTISH